MGAAAAHFWLGHGANGGLHRHSVSGSLGLWLYMACQPDCRHGPGPVIHRRLPASDGRAQPHAHTQRASGLLHPAVSGCGRHPHSGADSHSGRLQGGQRHSLRQPSLAGHLQDRGHDYRRHHWRPPAAATPAAMDCAQQDARNFYRHLATSGRGHCHADDASGPVHGAGRVSGRCAAGRQRIPQRAGNQYRTLQGSAAGPVLHGRGHEH